MRTPGCLTVPPGLCRSDIWVASMLAAVFLVAPTSATATEDFTSGYFSRVGNDGTPAANAGSSLFVKFYAGQRVALLYLPYPYSLTLEPAQVDSLLAAIGQTVEVGSLVKSDFGLLAEPATVEMESFQVNGDRVAFQCGGTKPCLAEFEDNSMVMSKAGVVGEHILQFDQVLD